MANSETYPVVMTDPAPCRYMGSVGSASATGIEGFTELGTGSATAHQLNVSPAFGARVNISMGGTGVVGITTAGSGDILNSAGHRTVTLTGRGSFVSLMGVSTTRWLVT